MGHTYSHGLAANQNRQTEILDALVTYSMVGMVVDAFHLKDPAAMAEILESCAQIAIGAAEALEVALDELE